MLPLRKRLHLEIQTQPDDCTCGPTCLQAVYDFHGDPIPLERVVSEVPRVASGGTLGVLLGCHALRRGYQATLYTFNLNLFDPTWFAPGGPDLRRRLAEQAAAKGDARLREATGAFIEFLDLGGRLRFSDLGPSLLRRYLRRSLPILTGLSATYLYRTPREWGPRADFDDIRGEPAGHFVVLSGYHRLRREVLVADPVRQTPLSTDRTYPVEINRLICAILLGILTYDGILLILEPGPRGKEGTDGDARRPQ